MHIYFIIADTLGVEGPVIERRLSTVVPPPWLEANQQTRMHIFSQSTDTAVTGNPERRIERSPNIEYPDEGLQPNPFIIKTHVPKECKHIYTCECVYVYTQ